MNSVRHTLLCAGVLLALSACSTVGKNYSEINPEHAQAEVQKHNGYMELKKVKPETAKLVLRTVGSPRAMTFYKSTADKMCEGMQEVGKARNAGRNVLLPWIAKMTQGTARGMAGLKEYIALDIQPGQPIQIQAYSPRFSDWLRNGIFTTEVIHHACGPLTSKFTPEAGHAYLVEVTITDESCKSDVYDATNPDAPTVVAAVVAQQLLPKCPAP